MELCGSSTESFAHAQYEVYFLFQVEELESDLTLLPMLEQRRHFERVSSYGLSKFGGISLNNFTFEEISLDCFSPIVIILKACFESRLVV